MRGKKKLILLIVVVIGLLWMFSDALFQPGIKDLNGDFKEVVFLRNEQNTGPVIRLYVVTLKDTLWKEMETYGNYMPHNKYGTTKVYFFKEGANIPRSLYFDEGNFPAEYQPFCIGLYLKDGMSQVSLIKHPFRTLRGSTEKDTLSY